MTQPAGAGGSTTLFGFKGSGSAAVEMALDRCGIAYEVVEAASWHPGPGLDRLRASNPLAQIPTLQLPDGSILTESAAILIHLGIEHPGSGLLPDAASAKAQAIRGLVFIAANCYSDVSIIDYPERWLATPDEAPKENLRNGARRHLAMMWERFADQFAANRALNADAPGALDYLTVVVSQWGGSRAHIRTARPEFASALDRIERHPALAGVLSRHRSG